MATFDMAAVKSWDFSIYMEHNKTMLSPSEAWRREVSPRYIKVAITIPRMIPIALSCSLFSGSTNR